MRQAAAINDRSYCFAPLRERKSLYAGYRIDMDTFVTWLAGAGINPGTTYGQSDEFGYQAVDGKTYCYDLHATILHLLGIDHERLTYRHQGRDFRLTDVHGHVIHDILA